MNTPSEDNDDDGNEHWDRWCSGLEAGLGNGMGFHRSAIHGGHLNVVGDSQYNTHTHWRPCLIDLSNSSFRVNISMGDPRILLIESIFLFGQGEAMSMRCL